MKSIAITGVCVVLALGSVFCTRFLFPVLELIFRYIEASFAPVEPEPLLALVPATALPVDVTSTEVTPAAKPRATRKRATKSKASATAGA